MPQIFQTLRCYKCLVFQVHQAKKSNKWECKMCGEKQSIKRHYGIGTAKDCRLHVQKLNGIRGDIENNSDISSAEEESFDKTDRSVNNKTDNKIGKSKWNNFIDESEENLNIKSDKEETMYLDNIEVVLEAPKKKKKVALENKKNNNKHNQQKSDDYFPNLDQKCNKQSYLSININDIRNINPNIQSKVKVSKDNETKMLKGTSILNSEVKNISNNTKSTSKKDSKWAQYIDEDVCSNDEFTPEPEILNTINDHRQKKLSLFDDDENIGDILDL